MLRIHANNFSTTLNGAINDTVTSIVVTSAAGFPAIGSGVTCNISVQESTNIEIMKVTAITGTTLTVVRAQEDTTALSFSDASSVEIRFTRDSVDLKQDVLSGQSLTAVTPATDDKILIQDTSDSNNLKTVTSQSIANLAPTQADSDITFTDITTNNASTSKHGYLKKLSGSATEYMDGSGAWSTPAGGGGGSGGLVLLSVQTASGSSDLHFGSTLITSTYESYMFVMANLKTSGTTGLWLGLSTDNGATDVGGNDWYSQASIFVFNGPSMISGINPGTVSSHIAIHDIGFALSANINTNNGPSDLSSGVIYLHGAGSPSAQVEWKLNCSASGGVRNYVTGGGQNISGYTPPVNYVTIFPGSGNFVSGTIRLYGIQKV